jgi:hypothetical protein
VPNRPGTPGSTAFAGCAGGTTAGPAVVTGDALPWRG